MKTISICQAKSKCLAEKFFCLLFKVGFCIFQTTIVEYYKMGFSSRQIIEKLPHLTPEWIDAALQYYYWSRANR